MSTDQAYTSTATQSVPGSGGGSGTVTQVSGTTNQIDVATGTTTPVVSLDAAATAALLPYAADTGTANNLAVTVPNIPATATAGVAVRIKVLNSSSGATVLIVTPTGGSAWNSGVGIPVMKRIATGVAAIASSADINAGGIYEFEYDGTQWVTATTSSTVYTGGGLTANSLVRGNSNNQIQTTAGIAASTTVFTSMNSETLAGVGIAYERGVTSQKAETGADAAVLSVTPAAAAGTYRLTFVLSVATATAAVVGWTATWTDSNGNAQAPTNLTFNQAGAIPALTFTTSAASAYYGEAIIDVNNAATAIVVKLTFTGTSMTAKASATIERLQ